APVAGLAPAQLMQATQALLLQWLRAASRRAPLLLVCEDVHWADASTLALLQRLIESLSGASLLLVLTTRPGFDAPWPDDALAEALHALVAADLLQRQGVPPQTRYSFRHALLQAAAEESLLRSARAATHGRIADTLEARFPGTVDAEPETLARHRSEAGEPRR